MKLKNILFAVIFAVFLFTSAHGCCCCCPCCCCRHRHYWRHQYRQLHHHGNHSQDVVNTTATPAVTDSVPRQTVITTEAPQTVSQEAPRKVDQNDDVINRTERTRDSKPANSRAQ